MDLIELLRRVPLFQNLSEYHLHLVADVAIEHRVPAGTRLTRQADFGGALFVIADGEATIHRVDERGMQRPVGMVRPGEWFGVTSLFLREPRDASLTAVTPMRLWTIPRPAFEDLLERHPDLDADLWIPAEILDRLEAPRFAWMEPGEVVLFVSRRHWLGLALGLVRGVLAGLVIQVIVAALDALTPMAVSVPLWSAVAVLIAAALSVWRWVDWTNDYIAVTTWRVTHHERVAFIYESRSEAPLDRIQNIHVERGFWGSLLAYGTVTIETASAVGSLRFDRLPHPEELREIIFAQLSRVRATRQAAERHLIRDELLSRLHEELDRPAPQDDPSTAQPIDYVETPLSQEVVPGRLTRLLAWLSASGIVPQVRVVTDDAVSWRQHWIFLLVSTTAPGALSLALAITALLGFWGWSGGVMALLPGYPFVALFLLVVCLGWLWWQTDDWANDVYTVTAERIIDVKKRPLFFSEQRREASLGMIQNVRFSMPSFWAAMLNYGDVFVQTAGAGEFTFHRVPNPREVQAEIFRRIEAFREAQRQREASRRRSELSEWFSLYDELREQDTPPPGHESSPASEGGRGTRS
ncbi:MAG TPA: cyclic nucleotide-binding domain-containing protein [Chloroflexi bacterium]|jgi:membrane protein YdbS with pleckstrin-like domain|nr:cyclic nucleotide-binding domain-containing protein [Chloroflexota bacterium]